MVEVKNALGTLPVPSTEIGEVDLHDSGAKVTLRFEYWVGDDVVAGGVTFDRVRAYRHRAESHCTEWHIADVYDTLAEVEGSEWVAELLAAMQPDLRDMFEMHHYMIYFDSSGCYEVVAASWSFLPDVRVG